MPISGRMTVVTEDPNRPGYVDVQKLLQSCQEHPSTLNDWPEAQVDVVHGAVTEQLYETGCVSPPHRPRGFVPVNGNATAEFFSIFYQHCMLPTLRSRYLIEVANECNVKVQRCNTTWQEMIKRHNQVADSVHQAWDSIAADQKQKASEAVVPANRLPRPLVCGPTAAFPEFQLGKFGHFKAIMGAFINGTGEHLDCLSVHIYTTYITGQPNATVHRTGSNAAAILGLMSAFSNATSGRGRPLPLMVSEFGAGFKGQGDPEYSPYHDWLVLREVNGHMAEFLGRPAQLAKVVPFIVGRASWIPEQKHNTSHPYPFALWDWSGTPTEGSWHQTFLHLHYQLWTGVTGVPVLVSSSDVNVVARAYVDQNGGGVFVLLHSLHETDSQVELQLDAGQGEGLGYLNGTRRRLVYNESLGVPQL